ncbi:MAG: hypothetical protein U0136_14535 [Bdellovibrionota bacterium]
MDNISKNLRYLRFERQAISASLIAGVLLALLMPIGLLGLDSHLFLFLWGLHIAAHAFAVACAIWLLLLFGSALPAKARGYYAVLFLLPIVIVAVEDMLPILSRDALIYHLAVPKMWLHAGRITEIPWHEWSHFPLALSLGYAGFLDLGLAQLTPLYHATYLILVATVAAGFVHYKYQDEELSLSAALITLSLPICVKLAGEPMADLALAFYFGLTFVLFVVWGEQRGTLRQLAMIGLFLGLALSVKYNSLLAAFLFGLCMLSFLQHWEYPVSRVLTVMAVLYGTALLVFAPWLMKNFHYTGNPLYPFVGSIFGTSDELPFMGNVKPLEYRLFNYRESWWQVALIPFRMLFTGQDDNPKQFDGLLSPVLLLSIVPVFYRRSGERRAPWVLNTWLFIASYFCLSMTMFYALLRYQAPLLVAVVATTAGGLSVLGMTLSEAARGRLLRLIAGLNAAWLVWYSYGMLRQVSPWPYLSKQESKDQYLTRRLGEYSVASYVNKNLPQDAVVYLFYTGNRYFYYDRGVRGAYFSHAPVVRWLSEKNSAQYLAAQFHALGITHLAIQNARTKEALGDALTPEQKAAWTEFVQRYLNFVSEIDSTTLWELKPGIG